MNRYEIIEDDDTLSLNELNSSKERYIPSLGMKITPFKGHSSSISLSKVIEYDSELEFDLQKYKNQAFDYEKEYTNDTPTKPEFAKTMTNNNFTQK